MGQSNIWYGNDIENSKTLEYISRYNLTLSSYISNINTNLELLNGSEKHTLVKTRVNQNKFRTLLLEKYSSNCCLCHNAFEPILVASHIKPWSVSDSNEKVNPSNRLLLCATHDKLFDLGYIAFSDTGNIMVSSHLSQNDKILSNISEKMKISVTSDNIEFIRYHREILFKP